MGRFGGRSAPLMEAAVMVRLCLALLLTCACAAVYAGEVQMQTPNGETGTCPDVEATTVPTATTRKTAPAPAPARAHKPAAKPATTQGGGGGDGSVRSQGPRWHSFLPGMFR